MTPGARIPVPGGVGLIGSHRRARLMVGPNEFIGPLNLSNPGEYTMLELVEAVSRLTGSSSRFVSKPQPDDNLKQRRFDASRTRNIRGSEPEVPLVEGLAGTVEYFHAIW